MNFEDIPLITAFNIVMPLVTMDTCVIVPVKNEADHLEATLKSLCRQVDDEGINIDHTSYEVLVLVNNSDDASMQIAEEFKRAHPLFRLYVAAIYLPSELANIGTVRKLLMDHACRRFCHIKNDRGIIASIDGDTIADPQWIFHLRKEINAGNDAVGGRILTMEKVGFAEKAYRQDMIYRYLLTEVEQILCPQINDPLPRHFQFFGANMAVTAEYYQKSGGIPLVNCLEDMAFHQALIRCDAKIRRSLKVKVTTSARFEGRVAIGFSEQLKKWSDESKECLPQIVEGSELFIYSCFLKGQFQACWKSKRIIYNTLQIKDIALALGVSVEWLKAQVRAHDFFGACWEKVWEASALRKSQFECYEPIHKAIKNLKKFIQNPDVSVFQKDLSGIYQRADVING